MDSITKLRQINRGLNRRFPDGDNPFQIMTRLLEECGELAEQVHIFEGSGVKGEKHGAPDRDRLAKEVQDVMRCALQIATYYDADAQVTDSIENSYRRIADEG